MVSQERAPAPAERHQLRCHLQSTRDLEILSCLAGAVVILVKTVFRGKLIEFSLHLVLKHQLCSRQKVYLLSM